MINLRIKFNKLNSKLNVKYWFKNESQNDLGIATVRRTGYIFKHE